jgi:hypothetical protein
MSIRLAIEVHSPLVFDVVELWSMAGRRRDGEYPRTLDLRR